MYVEAVSIKCCHITQFHPQFCYALIFELLEHDADAKVFPQIALQYCYEILSFYYKNTNKPVGL